MSEINEEEGAQSNAKSHAQSGVQSQVQEGTEEAPAEGTSSQKPQSNVSEAPADSTADQTPAESHPPSKAAPESAHEMEALPPTPTETPPDAESYQEQQTVSPTKEKKPFDTIRRKKGDKVDLNNARIGFLGTGKMAEAIVKGLINYTKIDCRRIFLASKSGKNHEFFKQQGCYLTKRNYDIFAKMDCDIVFLSFHGFVIRQLYKTGGTRPLSLTTNYIPNQRHPVYLLSLVGGINLTDIKHTLLNPDNPDKYKIEMHRIMLNSSVAYGIGLGAIDIEPDSKKCSPIVRDLLTSFARVEYIPESNMDVACAVGGNGLAFCYYFLSALADGGFKMGLPKVSSVKLAAKTLQCAAGSLLESGKHPSDLRDQCTSPSGAAIYGIHVLDKADCSSGIAAAVEAAYKRIRELVDNSLS